MDKRIPFKTKVKTEYLERGSRLCIPAVEWKLYELVGAVALYWGLFEDKMNELLASFVAADSDPHDQGWATKNFRKRQRLLKDKVKTRFPGAISDEVCGVLEAAKEYHWQRNLIVHGHTIGATHAILPPKSSVRGYLNGRYVKMVLNADFMERMYHELGILAGRLEDLTATDELRCKLSLPDRQLLRTFAEKHRPTPPTPQDIEPRHPPLPK